VQLAFTATLVVIFAIVLVVFLVYQGWRTWAHSGRVDEKLTWRTSFLLAALILVSLSFLLFVAYAAHNVIIGGDRNGSATTILWIKTGNTLSFLAGVLSLAGKGRGRWLALAGGCLMLLLWFAQGMSL
jgi:hypothetical protein